MKRGYTSLEYASSAPLAQRRSPARSASPPISSSASRATSRGRLRRPTLALAPRPAVRHLLFGFLQRRAPARRRRGWRIRPPAEKLGPPAALQAQIEAQAARYQRSTCGTVQQGPREGPRRIIPPRLAALDWQQPHVNFPATARRCSAAPTCASPSAPPQPAANFISLVLLITTIAPACG